jgi:hypothetical protein
VVVVVVVVVLIVQLARAVFEPELLYTRTENVWGPVARFEYEMPVEQELAVAPSKLHFEPLTLPEVDHPNVADVDVVGFAGCWVSVTDGGADLAVVGARCFSTTRRSQTTRRVFRARTRFL